MKFTVYSTHTCPWCVKVKNFLDVNKIKYTDIYVDDNPSEGRKMIELSGQTGVPVIDIDGEFVVGFDKPELMRLLKLDKKK